MYPPAAARAQGEAWERLTGPAGLADDLERRAREQAAELERRPWGEFNRARKE
jgi:hypothetical protein